MKTKKHETIEIDIMGKNTISLNKKQLNPIRKFSDYPPRLPKYPNPHALGRFHNKFHSSRIYTTSIFFLSNVIQFL